VLDRGGLCSFGKQCSEPVKTRTALRAVCSQYTRVSLNEQKTCALLSRS
jgi:hypothetical protein